MVEGNGIAFYQFVFTNHSPLATHHCERMGVAMPTRVRSSGSLMWVVLVTATVGLACSGCGSGDFVPPPPPELQQGAIGGAPGSTGGSLGTSGTAPLPIATLGVRSLDLIL